MDRAYVWLARHAKLVVRLAFLGWFAWIAGAMWSGQRFRPGWLVTLFLIVVLGGLLKALVRSLQRMRIRESRLPVRVKRELRKSYPTFEVRELDLVERGFRQFFLACARSDGKFVAMPSKAVDDYWHAFIVDTKAYADWCERTLGRFLHHVPAASLGDDAKMNDGLRRAWFFACKEEGIDPRRSSRLPLLFALDTKLGVPGGLVYSPGARPIGFGPSRSDGGSGEGEITYGDDFCADGVAGDAGGFGGCDAGGGDGGGGDGGGGDGGGGCGGGGD